MSTIHTNTTNLYYSNESLNELLTLIDRSMLRLNTIEYNNMRLAMKVPVNLSTYNDLMTYKTILLNKLLGCNCLDSQFLINIIYKIKKLT